MRVAEEVFEVPRDSVASAPHGNAPHFSFTVYVDEETEGGFSWNAHNFPELLRWLLRVGTLRAQIHLERGTHEIWRAASLHLALRDTESCKTSWGSDSRSVRKRRASSKSLRSSKPRKSSSNEGIFHAVVSDGLPVNIQIRDLTRRFKRLSLS